MRTSFLLASAVILLSGTILVATVPGDDIAARAKKLHFSAIVLDTHDDTPQRMLFEPAYDIGKRDAKGHIDIPRMREGGLDGIFFSIYAPTSLTGPAVVKRSLDLIDAVREAVRKYPNDLMLATTAEDVRRAHRQGKIAALMGMEGGHMIDGDLRALRMYAALGVRYLTLAHSKGTGWAGSSGDVGKNDGLTDFGKDVVRELNRLGVMVDISHASDQTFYDALETSRAPLVASHSSCRAISNHPRNMTDDMIRALAKKGGVIQITYVDTFLSQELYDAEEAVKAERAARTADIDKKFAGDEARKIQEYDHLKKEFAGRMPVVSWEKIVEHIDHAVKVGGVDHVGLGSDFDGATMPQGMEDVSQLPKITEALLRKGYSERDVRKILGENLLRVMGEVERVSREMNGQSKK